MAATESSTDDVFAMTDDEMLDDYADCLKWLTYHTAINAVSSAFGSQPDDEQITGWSELVAERRTEILRRMSAK